MASRATMVRPSTSSCATPANSRPMAIFSPSVALSRLRILPPRPLSRVSAICWQVPSALAISSAKSSQRSALVPSRALTAARSVLLKIVEIRSAFCWLLIPSIEAFKSCMMALKLRISPLLLNVETPSSFSAAAAASVGVDRERMILRSFVPPSAPLMPLSASRPRFRFSSSTPPATILPVAPTASRASPNCAMLVLLFWLVFAMLSRKASRLVRPKALMASVAISLAFAKSILPAAARFNTLGSASIAWALSYPARAR